MSFASRVPMPKRRENAGLARFAGRTLAFGLPDGTVALVRNAQVCSSARPFVVKSIQVCLAHAFGTTIDSSEGALNAPAQKDIDEQAIETDTGGGRG